MIEITDKEFNILRDIMYEVTGVHLTDSKKHLAVFRLRKRLSELKIEHVRDYLTLIKKPGSPELETFINAITTNESSFYRYPQQFDWLVKKALPDIIERKKRGLQREIRIWSGACATGEEPYSIVIACREFFKKHPDWKLVIHASDINSTVLEYSREGKYSERSVQNIPSFLSKLYFSPVMVDGKCIKRKMFQLDSEIIKSVEFFHHNLLKSFGHGYFDVIFLRNVMIYFNQESKRKVIGLLENNLNDGGYFFTSIIETLTGVSCSLKLLECGIYQKIEKTGS